MKEKLNLFKLQYHWVEDEFMGIILGSSKDWKSIEKDLNEIAKNVKIKNKNEDYNPAAFDFIREKLKNKGYVECSFVKNPTYQVEEGSESSKGQRKYYIRHKIESVEWKEL